jgi:hypothetical protein
MPLSGPDGGTDGLYRGIEELNFDIHQQCGGLNGRTCSVRPKHTRSNIR